MNYSTYIKGLANLGSTFLSYHNPQHIKLVVVQKFCFRQSPVKHNSRVMNTMWIQFQIWRRGVFCSDKLVVSDGEGTGIAGAGAGAGAGAVMRCC
jgi:hypothetical protein